MCSVDNSEDPQMQNIVSALTEARAVLDHALLAVAEKLAEADTSDTEAIAKLAGEIAAIHGGIETIDKAMAAADRYQPDYFQHA